MTTPSAARSAPVVARTSSPANIGPVSWVPTRDFELPEWVAAGRRLGAIGRCGQWALGDWIRYGNVKFGERYARAARITGYDAQTLMNMVYVASSFEISRRRENISWSHHEAVAALKCDEQDHWLDRVQVHRLSVSDLRTELRVSARRSRRSPTQREAGTHTEHADGNGSQDGDASLTCPHCGGVVPVGDLSRVDSRERGPNSRARS